MATQEQNLQYGSRGSEVSQLQQLLQGFGLYEGRIDGIYGPKTQSAVKAFQRAAGISADGIVGPITRGQLQEWQQNPHLALQHDPIIQNAIQDDPIANQTFNSLMNEGGGRADLLASAAELAKKGYPIDFETFISPQKYGEFLAAAEKELEPEFNARLKYARADFEAGLRKEQEDYARSLEEAGDQFGVDRFALQNTQGRTNNVNSSLGAGQREGLVTNYNRGINKMTSDTKYSLAKMARQFEDLYGSRDAGRFDYKIPTGETSWWGGYEQGPRTRAYRPMGGITGKLRAEAAAQAKQRASQKATTYALGYTI